MCFLIHRSKIFLCSRLAFCEAILLLQSSLWASLFSRVQYWWYISLVVPPRTKWMLCFPQTYFPGNFVSAKCRTINKKEKKKKTKPVSCERFVHISMPQLQIMIKVSIHLPISTLSLHGQCACCPLMPLLGHTFPVLSLISDGDHPFQTRSLVSNPLVSSFCWADLEAGWKFPTLGSSVTRQCIQWRSLAFSKQNRV